MSAFSLKGSCLASSGAMCSGVPAGTRIAGRNVGKYPLCETEDTARKPTNFFSTDTVLTTCCYKRGRMTKRTTQGTKSYLSNRKAKVRYLGDPRILRALAHEHVEGFLHRVRNKRTTSRAIPNRDALRRAPGGGGSGGRRQSATECAASRPSSSAPRDRPARAPGCLPS